MAVLRSSRFDWRSGIRAPDDLVGSRLDFLSFEKVFALLVSREVHHAVALFSHFLRDREKNGVTEAAAREQHVLRLFNFRRSPGRPHHHDLLAALEIPA